MSKKNRCEDLERSDKKKTEETGFLGLFIISYSFIGVSLQ